MKETESIKGVPGILRPFKKYIEEKKIPAGRQIVFYGCPGTCLPFVELIAYAIRDLPAEIVFVPFLEEEKAVKLKIVKNLGAQTDIPAGELNPEIIVIMGGLAMPNIPVSAKDAKETAGKYNAAIVGICFMEMLEKEGWTKEMDFDMIIDASIDPVKIYR